MISFYLAVAASPQKSPVIPAMGRNPLKTLVLPGLNRRFTHHLSQITLNLPHITLHLPQVKLTLPRSKRAKAPLTPQKPRIRAFCPEFTGTIKVSGGG